MTRWTTSPSSSCARSCHVRASGRLRSLRVRPGAEKAAPDQPRHHRPVWPVRLHPARSSSGRTSRPEWRRALTYQTLHPSPRQAVAGGGGGAQHHHNL